MTVTMSSVCEETSGSDSGVFLGLSVVFLVYLSMDIGLAAVAILRARPTLSRFKQ